VALARDILWLAAVVGGVALLLFLVSGTWPAVVTIESGSMEPHMKIGDLVFVVEKDRFGPLQTWEDGKASGYTKFEDYGDVIIYQPNGMKSGSIPIPLLSGGTHPIIHRVIQHVDAGPVTEIKQYNVTSLNFTASHAGYITWGDNTRTNPGPDQFVSYKGIGQPEPVKDEWIVGKALFTIPLVGYLPLNIGWVVAIVIVLMVLHELWLRSKEEAPEQPQKKGGRKKQ
jgi:signal peptidase